MTNDPEASGPREFGQYVLLRELGRGAIGVVYAAYDEGLDRKLAIKVLNRARAGRPDLEARLLREARALARLSHPNVVQVYDVGEIEGRVYVVMEFVEGRTLGEWMRQHPPLDDVLAMFIAAGRGLAAAHAAGVVHRDFKPDNVIVGVDGRPRVLDFGLAREVEARRAEADVRDEPPRRGAATATAAGAGDREPGDRQAGDDEGATRAGAGPSGPARELAASRDAGELAHDQRTEQSNIVEAVATKGAAAPEGAAAEGADPGADPDDEFDVTIQTQPGRPAEVGVITKTGARLGTPAYMSPEQFRGQVADQASDQFSFCVALHEAVYGRRPFPARNQKDLSLQVQTGRVIDAPPDTKVPAWLRAVILRGLSAEATERWPSMEALLEALAFRPEQRTHRRWTIGLALGCVATVALVVGVLAPRSSESCPTAARVEAQLWSRNDRSAVERAFARSGSSFSSSTWASVQPRLDAWVEEWAREQVDACTFARAADEGSLDANHRAACLDRSRRAFLALREQFLEADARMLEGAVEAVIALPDPLRCREPRDEGGVPPQRRAEIAELRSSLAEIDTRSMTGRSESALPLARVAVERARLIGYAPVIAEALLIHARLLIRANRFGAVDQALVLLEEALDLAERSGAHELAPRVAIELVSLSIYAKPDPVRGRLWARRANAGLDRLTREHAGDDALGLAQARGKWALGNLERLDGNLEQAHEHLREALALLDEHAPTRPERGIMLNDLGNVLAASGDNEGARSAYERALRASLISFGEGHPRVGNAHFNLARLAYAEHDLARAREQADLAFIVFAAARGLEHRDVAEVEILRAAIELGEGHLDAARERARKAQTIYDRELPPDNITRAEPHEMLGHAAFAAEDFDAAIVAYQASLAIKQRALPPGHVELVSTLTNLGLVRLDRAKRDEQLGDARNVAGDREAAVELLGQALTLLESSEGVDPEQVRERRLYLGDALLARGQPGDVEQAAALFDRGWDGCESEALMCAGLAVGRARARASLGDLALAREHAAEAKPWLAKLDAKHPRVAELIESLDKLESPPSR